MKISDLKPENVGSWVAYIPDVGTPEIGKIKSWNTKFIFVVYMCGSHWDEYQNYTAHATNPDYLIPVTK